MKVVCVIKQGGGGERWSKAARPVQSRRNDELHASAEFTLGYLLQSVSAHSDKEIPGRVVTFSHLTRLS